MRATDGQLVAVERDRLPGGLLHAVPRDVLAAPVAALAVRQRARRRDRRRGGTAGHGPRRRPGARPGRRRRHGGHRLRLPVGHVRARRRRAVRLLRQRGVHEHRRAALGRHPAGRAHRDHRGRRRRSPGNPFGQGKNVPRIAMAHGIPYVATATVADLRDLEAKVERAMELHGARYLHVLVPCPLGWGSPVGADRSASRGSPSQTGLFPVFEAERRRGHSRHDDPRQRAGRGVPAAAEALRPPVRATRRGRTSSPACRTIADRNIAPLRPARGGGGRDGQAVRHHARRRLVAAPTTPAPGAPSAPSTSDRLPPCNDACPAGEDVQGWLYHAERRRLRAGLAADRGGQPVPGGDGAGLLPPLRDRVQPRRSSTRRSASTPSSASSATRRSGGAGGRRRRRAHRASACWWSAPGPSGLSAAYHLRALRSRGRGPRRRPEPPAG